MLTEKRQNERYQYPDISKAYVLGKRLTVGELGTQNRFSGSIPLKTAKLFKGQGYVSLRSRLNGNTVQLGSLQRKLLKQPLVVHSLGNGTNLLVPLLSFI